jgi:nicotinate-nucleotide adenylyltransferase
VLGGAFNPPHLGHLVLAQEAMWQLGLDAVVFVPTGEPAHKEIEDDPGRDVRLEMTRLAVGDAEGMSVSDAEVVREGPSYSFETLELLAEQDPDTELCLLMGADAAVGFGDWKKPERIVELATLGVAGRTGIEDGAVRESLAEAGAGDRVETFEMPTIEISSSALRRRVAQGEPVRFLVPAAVAELIASRGLYA